MVKIAVFDSGLGSLSVIKPIQNNMKCSIIYFADSKNFPYGKKPITEIREICLNTISILKQFNPNLIIVGSNTLSLALNSFPQNILPILPPITKAKNLTKSKSIAILATESIVNSSLLDNYLKNFNTKGFKIIKINASPLVELVEHGDFYSNPKLCSNKIKKLLFKSFTENKIDVVTLSSTHLPFLLKYFKKIFPEIMFLDPSELLAKKLKKRYSFCCNKRNSLQIFTSGNVTQLKTKLRHLDVNNKIKKFPIK